MKSVVVGEKLSVMLVENAEYSFEASETAGICI